MTDLLGFSARADLEARRRQDVEVHVATDGGVTVYVCPEDGDVDRVDVDDAGQRRCPECGRVVKAIVADGGEPVASTGGGRHAPAMGGSTTPERCAHYCSEVGSTVYSPLLECPHECADGIETDGGVRSLDSFVAREHVDGVAEQDDTCQNDTEWCPGPNVDFAETLPCFDCFLDAGGDA